MEKANGGTKYNSTSVSFWIITVALLYFVLVVAKYLW